MVNKDLPDFCNRSIDKLGDHTRSFLRFHSGNQVLGKEVTDLTDAVVKLTGSIPERRRLYDGLVEAMTNVSNHAYPDGMGYKDTRLRGKYWLPKEWWMSASFDPKQRRLVITFFDQGVGIPETLPPKYTREKLRAVLAGLGLGENDASLIRAAMELGRSQTKQLHRGKGLLNIKKFTEEVNDGRLRILSGRGEFLYYPSETDHSRREAYLRHSKPIGGTLIQWEAII